MKRYNPKDIEPRWQKQWQESDIYAATEDPTKPKRYVLEYFPYPSGAAMHVGHVRNYTIGDAVARYYRMRGYNVMHPMGWDAFGLPAENYAIKNNISPKQAITENTGKFKNQLMQMGFSYDWAREIDSSDPKYYRWTQWFFKLLFDRGLAYQKESLQWWCDTDKTVLANEQVEAGKCWRCGNEVTKKPLKQWFFKITDYADRLTDDLEKLDWSDAIKSMQRNWIGKSKGAEIDFAVEGSSEAIKVFTTCPDTLFGVTFIVLAPEHSLTSQITTDNQRAEVDAYIKKTQAKSDVERQETDREKTGVFTGAYAINPVNGEKIPVWIADYVLTGYGTGAIMAVPAHDDRDYAFAQKFDLPVKQVVAREFGKRLPDMTDADGVNVIGYDPSTKEFMYVWNGNTDQAWLVGGGRNDGESYEEAAKRELIEEAGYSGVKDLLPLGDLFYCYYYNDNKKVNRRAKGYNYVAIIDKSEATNAHNESHEKFDVQWASWAEMRQKVEATGGGVEHWLDAIDRAKEVVAAYEKGTNVPADCYHGEGIMVNSGKYDDLESSDAREKIIADLAGQTDIAEYFDDRSPLKEGQPIVERIAAQAIVQHPTEDKYLLLRLTGWDAETYSLPMGGITSDDDAIDGAMRELQEETGFVDYDAPKIVAAPYFANFYHEFKKENRRAKIYTVATRLKSLKQVEVAADEKALHEPLWVSFDEVKAKVHGEGVAAALRAYEAGDDTPMAIAKEVVNYKIRDWLISRQRYWGAPIPIIHCPDHGAVAVPEDQLPVVLPEVKSYQPTGEGTSVLASVPEWVNTTCPTCGGPAKRETDTMDGFACSSWYFLRFADPKNDKLPFDKDKIKFWLPVDDYIGGAEHAVMHLLYARMWTKVMFDAGLIDFDEPFSALRNHGMILAPDGRKMSKSWGNVIAPDEIIEQGYGADAIRVMELFIGPWNQMAAWSVEGMGGCYRFLQRVWSLVQELEESDIEANEASNADLYRAINKATKKVTEDLNEMGFNTAIAALMELVNELYRIKAADKYAAGAAWQEVLTTLSQLLAPFAPHIAEELWEQLGNEGSVHVSTWPTYDEKLLVSDVMTVAVQVNGKVRSQIELPTGSSEADVVAAATTDTKVAQHTEGKQVIKTIYIPGKIVNLVVR